MPGGADFRQLNASCNQTLAALGTRARPGRSGTAWHGRSGDRMLSDDEWAHVRARSCTAPVSRHAVKKTTPVRWVAIRTPRITFTSSPPWPARTAPPPLSNDYYRVREACLHRGQFGLAHRTRRPDRSIPAHPGRNREDPPPRLAGSTPRHAQTRSQHRSRSRRRRAGLLRPLQQAGVLVRRGSAPATPARSPGTPSPWPVTRPAQASRLVRRREARRRPDPAQAPPPLERRPGRQRSPGRSVHPSRKAAIWDHAARTAADATAQIRQLATTGDPAAAADAAWAAGDTLHIAAAALGSRVIRQAAAAYDRAARAPYGRIPRPTPAAATCAEPPGCSPPRARLPRPRTGAGRVGRPPRCPRRCRRRAPPIQQHAAQAAAARHAAEQLHAAAEEPARSSSITASGRRRRLVWQRKLSPARRARAVIHSPRLPAAEQPARDTVTTWATPPGRRGPAR